ncbi:MAG TPA: hypothetical protein VFL64_06115 [Rhizobacter sp.]|nr:hypothetical protein [Rhizobacter sp.]
MRASFLWKPALAGAGLLALAGCAQMPTGPTVTVMPGPYKPFEVFVADDRLCRDWAVQSTGGPNNDASAQAFAGATATGALIGAAAGAAFGGSSGAGVGAAFGGMTGAAVGSGQSSYTAYNAQQRYDIAYQQCMYAKGNQIPGRYATTHQYRTAPAPVPPAPQQPPAGIQPPPPVR